MDNIDIDQTIQIDSHYKNKKGLCGLKNLGNTCFMNSIIQCLSNTGPLLEYMVSNTFKSEINEDKDEAELVENWNIVVRNLWHKNSIYVPNNFLKVVQGLAMMKNRGQFTGFQQNDSQEFLQFFLEMFHNAVCKEVNMDISGKPRNDYDKLALEAYKNYKEFFKNDYSEIVKIFYGQFFTRIKTVTGNKEEVSRSFEPFNMLSLELSPDSDGKYSLESCLSNFTKVEKLDTNKENTVRYKEVRFWNLPNVLVIYFKRWDFRGRKINTLVDFPIDELDMSKYIIGYGKDNYKYELYSISNHGGGSGGGHYWAYAKNDDGNWYKYNDNVVSTLNLAKIVSAEAYCLFYRLKN